MRETCARVLAAALMTGAIAFVLALPALFESAHERGLGLKTPPSSLRRTVHVPAQFAPSRPVRAERLAAAHPTRRPATQPAVIRTTAHPGAVLTPRGRPHTTSTGRAASPPPSPAKPAQTEPETRELASATPPAAAAPPASPAPAIPEPSSDKVKGKGRGKAKGHDKTNAESTVGTAVPQAGTTAAPPASPAPAPPEHEAAAAESQDHGQGHGKDKQQGHTD